MPANNNQESDKKLDLTQEKDMKIDTSNLPIFTMKKDLDNPEQSSLIASPIKFTPSVENKKEGKTPSSPFLAGEKTEVASSGRVEKPIVNQPLISEVRAENKSEKIPKAEVKMPIPEDLIKNSSNMNQKGTISINNPEPAWKKVVLVAIVVFIILALLGGGYYFWVTRQNSDNMVDNNPVSTEPLPESNDQSAPTASEPTSTFSEDKPNYLVIDVQNSDSAQIRAKLHEYMKQVNAQHATTPIEFLVVDSQNNPIAAIDFFKKAGVSLSQTVLSNLGDSFSLYIYNDAGKMRLGLAIDAKNSSGLKTSLTKEEPNLVKEVGELLPNPPYSPQNPTFGSSSYNGAEIRYQNIISPEELSIDYTVYKNKLVIGTTKMTLRTIIDKINSQTPSTN